MTTFGPFDARAAIEGPTVKHTRHFPVVCTHAEAFRVGSSFNLSFHAYDKS